MKDSKLTNAIIVNGVIYVAKRTAYPMIKDMCNVCDLKKKCDKMQCNPCEPFEKAGQVPYFRKLIF